MRPTVVAITGSYGKTSTKGHVAHLVGPSRTVVATPASFNNRAGLARAVNEQLADGTEVFVAEMGTYGPGEIADLCRWCPPDIAVITAIGPVHLERFGSEDRIVEAKSEILEHAEVAVLAVDDPRLAALADRAAAPGKRVVRCSGHDRAADVCVVRSGDGSHLSAFVEGAVLAEDLVAAPGVQPTNLACAIAVALALGVDRAVIAARLAGLPSVDHRLAGGRLGVGGRHPRRHLQLQPGRGVRGAGRPGGRGRTDRSGAGRRPGRRGHPGDGRARRPPVRGEPRLRRRRRRRGHRSAGRGPDQPAGPAGRSGGGRPIRRCASSSWRDRRQAVDWVREHLGPGDVVLYENDLPDHYP